MTSPVSPPDPEPRSHRRTRINLPGSEQLTGAILGYMLLILVPLFLVLVVIAAKFEGLSSTEAMDQAQLARHLAEGNGFVTSAIRPLSLVFKADLVGHPDLYHAPAYPLVLAAAFTWLHASDRVVAVTGGALWVLSVWLTFLVARQWFGTGIAALATIFYGCNLSAVAAACGGAPQPLLAISVLLAIYLAARAPWEDEAAQQWPDWRIGLTGLACGLAALAHYLLLAVAAVIAIQLLITQQRRGRALGWFLLGFLLPLLPWMWRSYRLVGSPFFSLFWYEALSNTSTYPGASIWRSLAAPPPSPAAFAVLHPFQMLRKAFDGLAQFSDEALQVVGPVIGLLFVAALLDRRNTRPWRHTCVLTATSLLLAVLGSCLLRPDPPLLLAWQPLLGIAAAGYVATWLPERVGRVSVSLPRLGLLRRKTSRQRHRQRRPLRQLTINTPIARAFSYLAVVGVVGFRLFYFISLSPTKTGSDLAQLLPPLQEQVRPGATVMTDQPALVAWFAHRRAVELCQNEKDVLAFESMFGPLEATLVTPVLSSTPAQQRGDWWVWVARPQGSYRGLNPVNTGLPDTVLKVRRPEVWR